MFVFAAVPGCRGTPENVGVPGVVRVLAPLEDGEELLPFLLLVGVVEEAADHVRRFDAELFVEVGDIGVVVDGLVGVGVDLHAHHFAHPAQDVHVFGVRGHGAGVVAGDGLEEVPVALEVVGGAVSVEEVDDLDQDLAVLQVEIGVGQEVGLAGVGLFVVAHEREVNGAGDILGRRRRGRGGCGRIRGGIERDGRGGDERLPVDPGEVFDEGRQVNQLAVRCAIDAGDEEVGERDAAGLIALKPEQHPVVVEPGGVGGAHAGAGSIAAIE